MNDSLTLYTHHAFFPLFVFVFVTDEEGDEHRRIHLTDFYTPKTARVAVGDVIYGIGGRVFVVWQKRARDMRVEVEEVVALGPDEVMRCRGATATENQLCVEVQNMSDSPSNTYRLLHLQRCLEGFPVHGCDLLNAQSGAYQYQGWLPIAVIIDGDFFEFVLVYIGAVT
jgi:hypothetical protein